MRFKLRMILSEDIDKSDNCIDGEITEFTNLREIKRPWHNGTGDWEERVEITHGDGSIETVEGHFIGTDSYEVNE